MITEDTIGGKDVVRIQDVTCKAMSAKALLCDIDGEEKWIPISQVHEDSEVFNDSDSGSEGELVLTRWIAEQKGLV